MAMQMMQMRRILLGLPPIFAGMAGPMMIGAPVMILRVMVVPPGMPAPGGAVGAAGKEGGKDKAPKPEAPNKKAPKSEKPEPEKLKPMPMGRLLGKEEGTKKFYDRVAKGVMGDKAGKFG
jgi:hypothetical protein